MIVDYLCSYLISGVSPSVCHLYPKAEPGQVWEGCWPLVHPSLQVNRMWCWPLRACTGCWDISQSPEWPLFGIKMRQAQELGCKIFERKHSLCPCMSLNMSPSWKCIALSYPSPSPAKDYLSGGGPDGTENGEMGAEATASEAFWRRCHGSAS